VLDILSGFCKHGVRGRGAQLRQFSHPRGEGKIGAKDARVIAETARMRRDLTEITTPYELVVELT
jgi:hypothetical protein